MKLFLKISYFLFLTLGGTFVGYAQMAIQYPAERSIFQRSNDNTGKIQISGNVTTDVDKVEARLIPRSATQGTSTDWTTIDAQVDGFSFTGQIEGKGGWYTLELRGVLNGTVTSSTKVQRVGIGEVFIIAGQSNARGEGDNLFALPASDDRVNTYGFNYYDKNLAEGIEVLPLTKFSQIQETTNPGPAGFSAWCWGELGDKLANKLNVPILFFNAALSGTSTKNWVESLNGQDTYHLFAGYQFEKNQPYANLRKTLQNVVGTLGVRTVLWHQGEFDLYTDEQTHIANLKKIIDETRKNIGEKIPWVVSRVSRLSNQNYPQVISAQNKVINPSDMIFSGPATDDIQKNRPDGAHFTNNGSVKGLSLLAEEWSLSLNSGFFSASSPIIAKGIVEIKHNCLSASNIELKFDKSYQTYLWSNYANTSTIRTSSGEYSISLRDNTGIYYVSSKLVVGNVFPKEPPLISPTISIKSCIGKTVELQSTPSKYETLWSTAERATKINAGQPTGYFATFISKQGCSSPKSNTVTPQFVPPPAKPTVNLVSNRIVGCKGDTVTVVVNNQDGHEVLWNNGAKTGIVSLYQNTELPLKVSLLSAHNCPSEESDIVKVNFYDIPKSPKITQDGPFSLKVENLDITQGYEWFLYDQIDPNQNTYNFLAAQNGIYKAKTVFKTIATDEKEITCKSSFSNTFSYTKNLALKGLSVYPNPSINGTVYVSSATQLSNVKIEIFNTIGQLKSLYNLESLGTPFEIKFNNLSVKNLYFVKVSFDSYSRVFPIVFN
jgi:Carbohydrate esterase, sialic acid-specific acetylesterase